MPGIGESRLGLKIPCFRIDPGVDGGDFSGEAAPRIGIGRCQDPLPSEIRARSCWGIEVHINRFERLQRDDLVSRIDAGRDLRY